ncbi:unnamed protein product, partial [marine sediment metagenome]
LSIIGRNLISVYAVAGQLNILRENEGSKSERHPCKVRWHREGSGE